MAIRKITLVEPFTWHDKRLTEVSIREPRGSDYVALGEPRILVRNSDGAAYWVEQTAVISGYLDRLIDADGGSAVLREMALADAIQIKDALLGFFIDADQAISSKNRTS